MSSVRDDMPGVMLGVIRRPVIYPSTVAPPVSPLTIDSTSITVDQTDITVDQTET